MLEPCKIQNSNRIILNLSKNLGSPQRLSLFIYILALAASYSPRCYLHQVPSAMGPLTAVFGMSITTKANLI